MIYFDSMEEQSQNSKVFSRRLLLKTAAWSGLAFLLSSCGRTPITTAPAAEISRSPILHELTDVIALIKNENPSSRFIAGGLQLFDSRITSINFNGLEIPITTPGQFSISTDLNSPLNTVNGYFSAREGGVKRKVTHKTDEIIHIPYSYLSKAEIDKFKKDPNIPFSKDGKSIIISVNFPIDKDIFTGFNPLIQIKKSKDISETNAAISFVISKEIAAAALFIESCKEVVTTSHNLGLPLMINNQEVLTQSLITLFERKGRTVAIEDVASYILAVWAWKNEPVMVDKVFRLQSWGGLVSQIMSVAPKEGEDPYRVSIDFVLQNPSIVDKFPHRGDYNKIP